MKKLMFAVVVGLMVMASASMAAAEITVGGDIETRYDLWNNLTLNRHFNQDTTGTQSQNFFADRILLNVDAKITEGLEAFVELDTDNPAAGVDERTWGVQGTNGTKFGSAVNYQANTVAVRQAWVNFMIPGIPVGMKIGHQPLALGHGIFLDTHRMGTDAILVYAKPVDQLLIAGVYAKVIEQSSSVPGALNGLEHHDADVYAALANFTWAPNNTVGVNYLYVHNGATLAGPPNDGMVRLHNVGVTADGAFGPITYKAEGDYQNQNGTVGGNDFGLNNAWAGMVGIGAKVAVVNVGVEAAYGTGNNRNANNTLAAVTGDPRQGDRAYLNPYGTTSYNYAFLYNDKIGQLPLGAGGGLGLGDGTGGFGLANTGYVKLTAGISPTDKLAVDAAVLYLRASEPMFADQSRSLGWEVDAHAGYKIYDNLNLDILGGVFLPGAWYDFHGATPAQLTALNGGTPLDASASKDSSHLYRNAAYGVETKLTVKF